VNNPKAKQLVFRGDSKSFLRRFEDATFDAVVTDPPYGLSKQPDMTEVLSRWLAGEDAEHTGRGFMGKSWDSFVPGPALWREVLRVLKPGGHALVFSGPRTLDLMGLALRLAGFEVRDMLSWIQGQGMPHGLDLSKAIDKARKEDREPTRRVCRFLRAAMDAKGVNSRELVEHFDGCHPRLIAHWAARDSDSQPNLPTAEQWEKLREVLGFGPEMDAEFYRLNGKKGTPGEEWTARPVSGVKVLPSKPGFAGEVFVGTGNAGTKAVEIKPPVSEDASKFEGWRTQLRPAWEGVIVAMRPTEGTFEANALEHGVAGFAIDRCRTERETITTTRNKPFGGEDPNVFGGAKDNSVAFVNDEGGFPPNVILSDGAAEDLDLRVEVRKSGKRSGTHAGKGGRAVYGEHGPVDRELPGSVGGPSRFFFCPKASRGEREAGLEPPAGGGRANTHPTVKNKEVMRWLCRLVSVPGDETLILDPFTGSGSTGIACALEGLNFVGVELDPEHVKLARERIAHWRSKR